MFRVQMGRHKLDMLLDGEDSEFIPTYQYSHSVGRWQAAGKVGAH